MPVLLSSCRAAAAAEASPSALVSGLPHASVSTKLCSMLSVPGRPHLQSAFLPACLVSLIRPMDVFKRPDPTAFKLIPPFPLHEEYLTVNGIK